MLIFSVVRKEQVHKTAKFEVGNWSQSCIRMADLKTLLSQDRFQSSQMCVPVYSAVYSAVDVHDIGSNHEGYHH
jgi:hypothetical protein